MITWAQSSVWRGDATQMGTGFELGHRKIEGCYVFKMAMSRAAPVHAPPSQLRRGSSSGHQRPGTVDLTVSRSSTPITSSSPMPMAARGFRCTTHDLRCLKDIMSKHSVAQHPHDTASHRLKPHHPTSSPLGAVVASLLALRRPPQPVVAPPLLIHSVSSPSVPRCWKKTHVPIPRSRGSRPGSGCQPAMKRALHGVVEAESGPSWGYPSSRCSERRSRCIDRPWRGGDRWLEGTKVTLPHLGMPHYSVPPIHSPPNGTCRVLQVALSHSHPA